MRVFSSLISTLMVDLNIKSRVLAAKRTSESVLAYGFLVILFIILIIVYIILATIGTLVLTLTDLRGLSKSDISLDDLESVLLTTEPRRLKEGFITDTDASSGETPNPRPLASVCNPGALSTPESSQIAIREVAPEVGIYIAWHTIPGVARVRSLIIPGDVPQELGGESFLLIHGINSTSIASWIMIFAELKKRAAAIYAVDLPGFGISQWDPHYPPPDTRDPSEKYVRVLGEYCCAVIPNSEHVEAANNSRLVLVGHSMGAYLAVKVALDPRYSARFSRLVLAAAVGILPSLGRLGSFFGMMFKVNVPAICYKMPFRRAIKKMYWMSVRDRRVCAYLMYEAEFVASMSLRSPLYDFINCNPLGMYWVEPILVDLNRLTIPFSTIYGADDLISPAHTGESLRAVYGSPHYVVPNTGHSIMYEKPHEFLAALLMPPGKLSEEAAGAEVGPATLCKSRPVLGEEAIKKVEVLLAAMMARATNMSILYDFKITTADLL